MISGSSQPPAKPPLCSSSLVAAVGAGDLLPGELCGTARPLQKAASCPGHTATASLHPLCHTTAQLTAQQPGFRTDPDRMADQRTHPAEKNFSLIRAETQSDGCSS